MAEDVFVYVETGGGSPIENATVKLHNSSSKALLQTSTTDSLGKASFVAVDPALNSGVYEIRIFCGFPCEVSNGNVQNITVLDSPTLPLKNEFDVTVTPEGLPTAVNTNLCRCSGYFRDPSGQSLANARVHFYEDSIPNIEYQSSADYSSIAVLPTRRVITTDSNGYASIDLYRNALYSVRVDHHGNNFRQVKIPDLAAANLVDILFPVVQTVKWYESDTQILPTASPTLALTIGTDKELEITVLLFSGVTAEDSEVSLDSSDEDVVTVGTSSGTVTLSPVAAGSATIQVTRATAASTGGGIVISPAPEVVGQLAVTVS